MKHSPAINKPKSKKKLAIRTSQKSILTHTYNFIGYSAFRTGCKQNV